MTETSFLIVFVIAETFVTIVFAYCVNKYRKKLYQYRRDITISETFRDRTIKRLKRLQSLCFILGFSIQLALFIEFQYNFVIYID